MLQFNEMLEKLLKAADAHGEDSGEPDHTVGDLQDLLRKAWSLMSLSQKLELMQSDEVDNVVECGAQDEFEAEDLVMQMRDQYVDVKRRLEAHGFSFVENELGTKWETTAEISMDYPTCFDAVEAAHKEMAEVL
ncbi:SerC protein [Novimethylophilus kurashikiensis]|uniref:SerC protein n=1 Tax=Novimethylophilus kurashikiensis TaxID=1825523 RepID=A0A2R5FCW4_9PROT|nr:hypothetical protein [Novimethylophilus kurashikiensis]GBG14484.1 SerC protein [Novimethylophilus kurashikiensis]